MSVLIQSHIRRLFGGTEYSRIIKNRLNIVLRRALDLVVATIGLLLLAPFFAFIALIIRYDTPGPIFYWSPRVGKHGKRFRMLKFRTMYEKLDSYQGPRITGSGDPRITPAGQWLRDTKLNELPQLWNVLKGEMSLVGPRPEDPEFVPKWPEEMQKRLLSVRPGMTSPASIVYRNEEEMMAAGHVEQEYVSKILPDKLALDARYVRQRSILGDLDILFWTFILLIPLLRRRQIPRDHLLWGPVARFVKRYFSWFMVDALVVFSIVAVTGFLWRSAGPLNVGWNVAFVLALLVTLIFTAANYVLGLGRIHWSKAKVGYVLVLFGSALLATIALLLFNQWLAAPLPPAMLMVTGLLSWLGFVAVRYRLRLVSGAARHWLNMRPATSVMGERALIVGSGVVGRWAAALIGESELLPMYHVVGWVDDNVRWHDSQIGGYRVLGATADIPDLAEKYEIDIIVFAIADCKITDRQRILDQCRQASARVIFLPDIVYTIEKKFAFSAGDEQAACEDEENGDLWAQLDKLLANERVKEARELLAAARRERRKVDWYEGYYGDYNAYPVNTSADGV